MFMNLQGLSVYIKPSFLHYFKTRFDIDDVQLHASNIYLFPIPNEGEFTTLDSKQKKFIFEKELGLYEEQYEITCPFEESLFDRFFEITWHGVAYHGEIKKL